MLWLMRSSALAFERFCGKNTGWLTLMAQGLPRRVMTENSSGRTDFVVEFGIDSAFASVAGRQYGEPPGSGLQAETEALKTEAKKAQ